MENEVVPAATPAETDAPEAAAPEAPVAASVVAECVPCEMPSRPYFDMSTSAVSLVILAVAIYIAKKAR